jgi:hypothetical protein
MDAGLMDTTRAHRDCRAGFTGAGMPFARATNVARSRSLSTEDVVFGRI